MFVSQLKKRIIHVGLLVVMAAGVSQAAYSVQPVNLLNQQFQKSSTSSVISNAKSWYHACISNISSVYAKYLHPCFARGLSYAKSYWVKQPTQEIRPAQLRPVQNNQSIINAPIQPQRQNVYKPSFAVWKAQCRALPSYAPSANPTASTAITPDMLTQELSLFYDHMNNALQNPTEWIRGDLPSRNFFNKAQDVFEPYVQRVTLPTNSEVAFHGDFHGDVHALNDFIQTWKNGGYIDDNFKIIRPNFYIVFLGDYTDRGWYGVEVIYALLRLKNANPDKVFMVRGNHEDATLNENYGFKDELGRKFKADAHNLSYQIYRIYNYLPLALYLGSPSYKYYQPSNAWYVHVDYIQCCHGGIEIGYNPTVLLSNGLDGQSVIFNSVYQKIKRLHQQAEYEGIKQHVKCYASLTPNNAEIATDNGFMWSDFDCNDTNDASIRASGRGAGLEYGKHATNTLLRAWSQPLYAVRSIFRAHQHTGQMENRILNRDGKSHHADTGIGKLWEAQPRAGHIDGVSVITFAVSPRSGYGYPYDAFGLLSIRDGFDNWRIQVIRNPL